MEVGVADTRAAVFAAAAAAMAAGMPVGGVAVDPHSF
jgi:hypothetical protein